MMLKLEVEDRGPYVALTQGGKVLTQGQGGSSKKIWITLKTIELWHFTLK